ncbi:MAG: hypothetical protein WC091_19170 [Sulfuricellaceae bacterium]
MPIKKPWSVPYCLDLDIGYTLRGHNLRIYPSPRGRGFRVANCLCGTATRRNLRSNRIPRDAAKSANCGRAKYKSPALNLPIDGLLQIFRAENKFPPRKASFGFTIVNTPR